MNSLLTDPLFYATAIPAVILVGLSKGGLGGAMALIGVPLMSLVVSPVQAAAIMLPILIVMDIVSLWTWRGQRDPVTLRLMLPGAMVGIGIGWAMDGVAGARVVRPMGTGVPIPVAARHAAEFVFTFVLDGGITLQRGDDAPVRLGEGDSFTMPAHMDYVLSDPTLDLQLLDVTLPDAVPAA